MAGFIGVNGKAQNIEKIFVGVNGKAKEVQSVFVGVNGKAKQVYSAAPPVIEEMRFGIIDGDFKIRVSGKNVRLIINDEEQSIQSGVDFSKTVSAGTAILYASKITSISLKENTALHSVDTPFPANSVTSFASCFESCSNLTSIPEGLFDNCTAVTSFASCFKRCSNLTSIPEGLFDNCTAVTKFTYCFSGCSNLTSIPEGLFDNCTAVYHFESCFGGCSNLASIPEGLFDNCTAAIHFGFCFSGCSNLASAVPELWDVSKWPEVMSHSQCFYNCTKAANYADIPSGWK